MSRLISTSLLLCCTQLASANSLSGKVVDLDGMPVSTGNVQIMGTSIKAALDAEGQFSFTGLNTGEIELHVSSPKFIHANTRYDIPEQGLHGITLTVTGASIEVFDVTASAFHASNIESASPVNVLAAEELRLKQSATLGDTLKNEVGVHSTSYAGVTSSPIIRGLDGPRVLITQNGMDAGDASRVGPDHLVSTDTSTATQIEVLRGPATLFYGSGAIGGVVNVVDQRIPEDSDFEGEFAIDRNSNNDENAISANIKTGTDKFAINLQGFYRDADSYRIPGFAENPNAHDEHDDHEEHDEDEHHDEHDESEGFGIVENTQAKTSGATIGASYLMDNGMLGFSFEQVNSLYGIPGHSHGGHADEEHEEHDEEHADEEHHEGEGEESVQSDLKQNRFQLAHKTRINAGGISEINSALSYTDYEHAEIEEGVIGTRFASESTELRSEIIHEPIMGWRGGVSLHYKKNDFEAIGEEAFTPPSLTTSFGVGLIQEQHFGDFLVQFGARVENVSIDVAQLQIGELAIHSEDEHHDEEHHDDEHADEHHDDEHHELAADSAKIDFTPISISLGTVWDFTDGYNFGASFVHAQRAPSSAEVFSFGPHIGTSTYEIGAFYELHEEGDVELSVDALEMEKSNNIDLSLRKFSGDFGFVFNLFYNKVDNYYYASDTGLLAEVEGHDDAHGEEHDDEHADEHHDEHSDEVEHMEEASEDEHADDLPIFNYLSQDVTLYGFEAEINWQVNERFSVKAQADTIRSSLDNYQGSKYLPRTPPTRFGASLHFADNQWSANASVMRYAKQDRVAEFEDSTDGYSMVDADINYYYNYANVDMTFYLKGRNLTNSDARVHTSFLKDLAPLPSRSVIVGVRAQF